MEDTKIKQIVNNTIEELQKKGMLRGFNDIAYKVMAERLNNHFHVSEDNMMTTLLKRMEKDQYISIIYYFYKDGFKIESIAEILGVDESTVTRNKKRLCIELYRMEHEQV